MKRELSSLDVRVLVRELSAQLEGARVDKAYQVGRRELVLKLYGRGTLDLVAAPNYMCVTKYRRPAPKTPSSFSMQLRKHLRGARMTAVRQHAFDRIIEIMFEEHTLVFELFSKGNIIFCDKELKILGLLEWQKWKDRVLGVGKTYDYPPAGLDPFEADEKGFSEVMTASGRQVAAALATRYGLGGNYAELVCLGAGIDPKAEYSTIDGVALWASFRAFLAKADMEPEARLTADSVTPFGGEGAPYGTFNEAVDEYFTKWEDAGHREAADTASQEKKAHIAEVLAKQEAALARAREDAESERLKGDLIYQRMGEINVVLAKVRESRKAGIKDDEILAGLQGYGFVKGLKGHELTLEL